MPPRMAVRTLSPTGETLVVVDETVTLDEVVRANMGDLVVESSERKDIEQPPCQRGGARRRPVSRTFVLDLR